MITLTRREVNPLLGEPVPPTGGRTKGWVFSLSNDIFLDITLFPLFLLRSLCGKKTIHFFAAYHLSI
jgi:hypothetical protein